MTTRTGVDNWVGVNSHHYETYAYHYAYAVRSDGTYTITQRSEDHRTFDCDTWYGGACSGSGLPRSLGRQWLDTVFDPYGIRTFWGKSYYDESGAWMAAEKETAGYLDANTELWLVRRLSQVQRSSVIAATELWNTRTIDVTTDPTTGEVGSLELERLGDPATHITRTFQRNSRGQLRTVTENAILGRAADHNVPLR